MKVFLTGGSGVIGRRALPMLLADGHEVTVAVRPGSGRATTATPGATVVAVDIFDSEALRPLMQDHDAVINLATRVPSGPIRPLWPGSWSEMDRIRRDASRALTSAARSAGVHRFVQESFAPIYADAGDRWIDETAPGKPARYNRTVLDAERAALEFGNAGGIGVVLRFTFFYGEGDALTRTAVQSIRRGWFPFFGRPDAYLSMVHHHDAASAAVAALAAPAGVYNVADDEPLTRAEFGRVVAEMLGVKPPRMLPAWATKLAGPVGETIARSLRISNKKLRLATGWAPRYPSAREGWRAATMER